MKNINIQSTEKRTSKNRKKFQQKFFIKKEVEKNYEIDDHEDQNLEDAMENFSACEISEETEKNTKRKKFNPKATKGKNGIELEEFRLIDDICSSFGEEFTSQSETDGKSLKDELVSGREGFSDNKQQSSCDDEDAENMPFLESIGLSPVKPKDAAQESFIESLDTKKSKVTKATVNERGQKRRKVKVTQKEESDADEDGPDFHHGKYSITGEWYVAAGYLNDIIELLDAFEATSDCSFNTFAECWVKAKFSLIFRGRRTFKELLEFSEEICLLTKRFLHRPHSLKRRIGALYALYGLYYKHPLRCFFSIRMEMDEYKEVYELVKPFFSNTSNPDPAFIFRKLEVDGAFLHCATSTELTLELHNEQRLLVDLEYGKEKLAKSSLVNEALPLKRLHADRELLKTYVDEKKKVAAVSGLAEKPLSMVDPNFVGNVIHKLTEFRRKTLEELNMREPFMSKANGASTSHQNDEPQDVLNTLTNPHQISSNVFDTVNNSRTAAQVQSKKHELDMLKDTTIEFMKSTVEQTKLLQMNRPSNTSITKPILTLDECNSGTYNDNLPDIGKYLKKFTPTIKRKRQRCRKEAIMKAVKSQKKKVDRKIKKLPKNTSATALPFVSDTMDMKATILVNGQLVTRKIKVKISEKKWAEISKDQDRLNAIKLKIRPLLKFDSDFVVTEIQPINQESKIVFNSTYMRETRGDDELSDISSNGDKNDNDYCAEDQEDEESDVLDDAASDHSLPYHSEDDLEASSIKHRKRTYTKRENKHNFGIKSLQRDYSLQSSGPCKLQMTKIVVGNQTKLIPEVKNEIDVDETQVTNLDMVAKISRDIDCTKVCPTKQHFVTKKSSIYFSPFGRMNRNKSSISMVQRPAKRKKIKQESLPVFEVPDQVVELCDEWDDGASSIADMSVPKDYKNHLESDTMDSKSGISKILVDPKTTMDSKCQIEKLPIDDPISIDSKCEIEHVSLDDSLLIDSKCQIEKISTDDNSMDIDSKCQIERISPNVSPPTTGSKCEVEKIFNDASTIESSPNIGDDSTYHDDLDIFDALSLSIEKNVFANPNDYQKIQYADGREILIPKAISSDSDYSEGKYIDFSHDNYHMELNDDDSQEFVVSNDGQNISETGVPTLSQSVDDHSISPIGKQVEVRKSPHHLNPSLPIIEAISKSPHNCTDQNSNSTKEHSFMEDKSADTIVPDADLNPLLVDISKKSKKELWKAVPPVNVPEDHLSESENRRRSTRLAKTPVSPSRWSPPKRVCKRRNKKDSQVKQAGSLASKDIEKLESLQLKPVEELKISPTKEVSKPCVIESPKFSPPLQESGTTCSFLFSPTLRPLFESSRSFLGEASGTPCQKKRRVSFFKIGTLKERTPETK